MMMIIDIIIIIVVVVIIIIIFIIIVIIIIIIIVAVVVIVIIIIVIILIFFIIIIISPYFRVHQIFWTGVFLSPCSLSPLRGPRNRRGIFAGCELFPVVLLFGVDLVRSCQALRFSDVLRGL